MTVCVVIWMGTTQEHEMWGTEVKEASHQKAETKFWNTGLREINEMPFLLLKYLQERGLPIPFYRRSRFYRGFMRKNLDWVSRLFDEDIADNLSARLRRPSLMTWRSTQLPTPNNLHRSYKIPGGPDSGHSLPILYSQEFLLPLQMLWTSANKSLFSTALSN